MKRILLILIISTSSICFGQDKPKYKQEAIEYYEKAGRYLLESKEDSVLIFCDKAIEIDDTYYFPHNYKLSIYISKKKYDKALEECNMILIKKVDLAEVWTLVGVLNAQLGNIEEANTSYLKSIDLFTKRIDNSNNTSKDLKIANRLNRAVSYLLMGKEDIGKKELNQLKKENPDNEWIDQVYQISKDDLIKQLLGM